MSKLMDLRELAAYLRLDRQTLYNWLHHRKLSGIKMGGVWRFDRQAIDRWLQEQTILAAPAQRSSRTTAAPQRLTEATRSASGRPATHLTRSARSGAPPSPGSTRTAPMTRPASVMEGPA